MHPVARNTILALIVAALIGAVLPSTASAAPPEQAPSYHVVRHGETLYSIARRYGYTVHQLAVANNIVNPNRIYAGQRLYLPPHSSVVWHRVQRGDNLFRIALRYGTSVRAIMSANGLQSTRIYVGQSLRIPSVGGGADYYTPSPGVIRYCIRSGDTLTGIAARYGTTVRAIMTLNRMQSTRIYAGQCILVDP